MSSEKEYRAYADECFGWAKTAQTEKEREIFLQMAETWLRAALIAKGPRPAIPAASSSHSIQARQRRQPARQPAYVGRVI